MSRKNNPFAQSPKLWQITIECTEEEIPKWEEYFDEKSLAFITRPKDDAWLVEVIVDEYPTEPVGTIEEIEDKDWLKEVGSNIGDVKTSLFHITREESEKNNLIPIIIANPRAFGMGDHITTIGCLNALEELYESGKLNPNAIMDVGTGTGILAIAAKKLYSNADVFGVDICHEAVEISKEHAKLNETDIEFDSEITKYENQKFDLILANILANPLMDMANTISNMLNKNGYLILSGFTSNQLDDLEKTYKNHSLRNVKITNNDEWIVIIMEKT